MTFLNGLKRAKPLPVSAADGVRDRVFITALVILVTVLNAPVLTRFPSPGGDEPSFVDAAVTLATKGYLANPIHRDFLPGIERHLYWQPPAYFVALAGWFKLFGIGLLQARSFSLLCGVLLILAVYALSRHYSRPLPSVIAAALCAISAPVTNATRFSRMDGLCVALVLWCGVCYVRASANRKRGLFSLCGSLAAAAVLTHPLGLAAIVIVSAALYRDVRDRRIDSVDVFCVAGCFFCGAVLWAAYVSRDPQSFQLQMTAQFARKLALGSYWSQFWIARKHSIILVLVLASGARLAATKWQGEESIIALGFAVSFFAATYGREAGYFLYFYPWGCCSVAVLLNGRQLRSVLHAFVILAFFNEAASFGYDLSRFRHRDYDSVVRTVRNAVPAGSTVFIGFPEVTPYFGLIGRNPMRAAVPVGTPKQDAFLDAARNSDFIAVSIPVLYMPDVADLLASQKPVAVVDQGPGYRLAIFRGRGAERR